MGQIYSPLKKRIEAISNIMKFMKRKLNAMFGVQISGG
jgi:hypothetical protein